MSTHRLYYDDSYLQSFEARVLSCLPAEPFATESGVIPAWEVVLDQSAFYPTSGGQPHDLGCLGDAKVLDVRDDGEDVLHIVDRELAIGPLQGSIQWQRRFDHMQQHTGQHLLSAMFHERFGRPTVSFHLGSEICTIDLRGPEPNTSILEGAQRAANLVIFEDRTVNVRYGTSDQLTAIGVRKEVEREGILRAIEIESADLQPCGGTHVRSTGQIGMILVRRCTKIRQDWRIEFACGARAERFASSDFQRLRSISDRLSCAPEDILGAVEKLSAERDANFKSLREMSQQLAEARAELLASATPVSPNGLRVIAQNLSGSQSELLLPLATEITKTERTIALLIAEDTGQIVFAQHPSAGKDMQALLKMVGANFPAKGGGTKDFVRAKLADPGNSAAALDLAKKSIANWQPSL
ncbi:MAG TPA: DHHA1 domain-containing protein [Candidatus Acidoferrum sp.]